MISSRLNRGLDSDGNGTGFYSGGKTATEVYAAFRDAANATGRPMALNVKFDVEPVLRPSLTLCSLLSASSSVSSPLSSVLSSLSSLLSPLSSLLSRCDVVQDPNSGQQVPPASH